MFTRITQKRYLIMDCFKFQEINNFIIVISKSLSFTVDKVIKKIQSYFHLPIVLKSLFLKYFNLKMTFYSLFKKYALIKRPIMQIKKNK